LAKRVAVIDIGSNSIRMVVYEKTSRFAFHLLHEAKSKVRLSENAYQNGGNLQPEAMQRTYNALSDFLSIAKSFNARKTLCVATSALRDAPNKKDFLSKISKQLQLNIKIIDGEKEAYLGSIACANLLPEQHNAISIDIGGGSTEFSLIDGKNVTNSFSLKLGTVRLKELYFDNKDIDGAIKYIDEKLECLDKFDATTLIGVGGTFRAISSVMIKNENYPLNKLHAYECSSGDFKKYLTKLLHSDAQQLKKIGIKQDRFDIIKPGVLILQRVLNRLSINKLITSGVGVRDGVYLADLLRHSKDKFPSNYNTSVRYLIDSHINDHNYSNQLNKLSKEIFDLVYEKLNLNIKYRRDLSISAKLYPSGSSVHFYSKNKHSYYLILSALEYGFTHKQILLIATLNRYAKNKHPSSTYINEFKDLLPDLKTLEKLSYILSLTIALLSHRPRNIDFKISFENKTLKIDSKNELHLSKEAVKRLSKIKELEIEF